MKQSSSITTDDMVERRELTRNVHIDAKSLQRNIQSSLLAQLRMKYEGICVAEGYIQRRSITIAEHSLGRTNFIKGGLDYAVRFQCDICMPHPGQTFRMPVTLKSRIGVHAELTPIKALLPRDLHIGLESFDDVKEGQEIEFEVMGARFQQGDDSIVVLGKLRDVIDMARSSSTAVSREEEMPMVAAPLTDSNGDALKKVTIDVASAKASEPARKRRVKLNPDSKVNEPPAEGSIEGKN